MLMQVMTKAHKHLGVAYPAAETEFAINFNDDKSITLYRRRIAGTTFKVGDIAEYDSFNLRYTGTITKITDKAITIVSYINTHNAETHRLPLYTFCWRNYNFNAERIAAENAETMMCI